ncbi:MAG: hypothetical protein V3R29_13120, partial [Candidatus Acidoferrales bacterium]
MRNWLRRGMLVAVVVSVVVSVFFLTFSQPASAVPSFARKYKTSCMTCHVAPPKLNAFGRAFRNSGYRMPEGDEDLVKQEKSPLGAPAWKQVWPEGIWPADIPGGTMLGFILESSYTINQSAQVTNEFDGIEEIGLLLGGTVGESFSFFGDIDLFEEGEPGGIGRLFFQYNNPSRYFNVKIGQFEPRAVPFSNHRRLIRLTNYLSNVFPTVPAGNFFGFSPNQKGVELWGGLEGPGGKGGLLWAVGVVNGEFGGAAEALEESALGELIEKLEEHAEEVGGEFDVNSGKDVYLQASYKIGGLGVFGSGSETTVQTNNWRDDSLTLGGYLYRGTAGAFLDTPLGEVFEDNGNRFIRAGVTFDWWFKDLNLFGGFQINNDDLQDGREFNVGITTIEANYVTPWPWVQPAVRFEAVNPDFGSGFNRTTISTTLLLRANVILGLEGSFSRSGAPLLP